MKSGGRFSANARKASALAGPAMSLAKAAFSRARAALIGSRCDSMMVRLVSISELIGSAASVRGVIEGRRHQFVGLALAPDEAHRHAIVGRQPLGAHQRPRGVLAADELREREAAGGLGRHAEAGERTPQPRRARHERQIGVAEDGCADADTDAVDRDDQRLGEDGEQVDQAGETVSPRDEGRVALRSPRHLEKVGAGAEGPPRSGEHHHRHRMVIRGGEQRIGRGVIERFIERVERLDTVEGQYTDT